MIGKDTLVVIFLMGPFAAGCGATPSPPTSPAVTAPAPVAPSAVSITVTYREAANVFEILDNLSNWWSGKCEVEYRTYWKERFGITAEDDQRFAAYKQLRKRHYPHPPDDERESEARIPLFGPVKPADLFAEAFYASDTVEDALAKLEVWMPKEDVAALAAFYAAYRPSIEILLAESAPYREMASLLQKRLDDSGARAYASELARWYGVDRLPPFTVLYVWWPPVDHVTANNRDRFLLLKYNPTLDREGALRDIDIPVHEVSHYVSGHQSEERKRVLAKAFLAGCDFPAHVSPVKILEEPMAVVHQKLFLKAVDPTRFDLTKPWYGGDPWVSPFAKAIYPSLAAAHQPGRTLDEELMRTMARSCATVGLDGPPTPRNSYPDAPLRPAAPAVR